MVMSAHDRAKALLGELAWTAAERDERLQQASDVEYWRRLNPSLTVCGDAPVSLSEAQPLDEPEAARVHAQLARQGYLQAGPILSAEDAGRLRDAVERLRAAGWPPVFAFVYDEFWDLGRTPSMVRLLTDALGPGYRSNAIAWCFRIAPTPGAAGWPPHCDGDRSPANRLNLWFPLTDATLDNGCIYVIPQHALDAPVDQPAKTWSIGWDDMRNALQAVHALPMAAGGVLGWRFHVWHWGSIVRTPSQPRISVALEFLGGDVTPDAGELPLLAGRPDSLSLRLFIIGTNVLRYEDREAFLAQSRGLAEILVARYRPAE
jgi:hypothetical protein